MQNDVFLTAEWRKLAIANYVVDPKLLRPYLPVHTEMDFWEGNCYVSLVAFMFMNTRIKNYRIPFHRNFEEVNLRFYVRYKEGAHWKRGVVFIREYVPLPMVTLIANTLYDERYQTVSMQHQWTLTNHDLRIRYQWKKKGLHSINIEGGNNSELIAGGSKEEYITQHFWGYSKKKNYTSEYQVDHELWRSYPISAYTIDVDFGVNYGKEFASLNSTAPDSVFLVEGSDVRVFRDRKIY